MSQPRPRPDHPKRIGILILPGFPMMAFSGIVEPYRAANIGVERQRYEWVVVSPAGGVVPASNGLSVEAGHVLGEGPDVNRIVVCSGGDAERYDSRPAFSWLRRQARRGAEIGAVADGAFFLARAGLLDGHACCIHWESVNALGEAFPDLDIRSDPFVIDGTRFTSAGGIAAFEMTVALIGRDFGAAVASAVSDWFVHDTGRRDVSALALHVRQNISDPLVLAAIALMDRHMETPLAAGELAERLGTSRDTLERRFRSQAGRAPMAHYRKLRLERAKDLLARSVLPVGEIALACGFCDAAHFSQAYRAAFGLAPREARQRLRSRAGPGAAPAGNPAATSKIPRQS